MNRTLLLALTLIVTSCGQGVVDSSPSPQPNEEAGGANPSSDENTGDENTNGPGESAPDPEPEPPTPVPDEPEEDENENEEGPGVPPPSAEPRLVVVGNWGFRASNDGAGGPWTVCGNPIQSDDHTPDLLRNVAYGNGLFVAVGGDRNSMVMRSADGIHWEEDLHPGPCDDESYPSTCNNWMGGVAFGDGVWVAGGGNGALMRSTDRARTWTKIDGFVPGPVRQIVFGDGAFYASSDGGRVSKSTDGGLSWTESDVADVTLRLAAAHGVVMGVGRQWNGSGFDRACRLDDGSGTFVACPSPLDSATVDELAFGNQTFVIRLTSGDLASSDDGATWSTRTPSEGVRRLVFADGHWLGTSGGRTFSSTDLETWVDIGEAQEGRAIAFGWLLSDREELSDAVLCPAR